MQNGYVESFNGRMRDELLNESLFFGLDHARSAIAEWRQDFDTARPHSSLGYGGFRRTPHRNRLRRWRRPRHRGCRFNHQRVRDIAG